MRFEWDDAKSKANVAKHGVSFEEAVEVFEDPFHLALLDRRFEYFEERWITIGQTSARHLLVVANLYFTKELEEVVRIISAREPSRNERRQYEERE